MAFIEGTLEEIYTFLGPRTSDIVTQLAKPHRKTKYGNRISCGEELEGDKKCKKYKGLHAAHIKGRERKILIQEILEEFGEKNTDSTYKIDLNLFEEEFKKKHENFNEVIKFMCPKHHKNYDLKNGIDNSKEVPIIISDDELVIENINLEDTKSLKAELIKKIDYLSDNNCSIAKISNENWNFNCEKNALLKVHFLICLNQFDSIITILKINDNQIILKPKKSDINRVSLNIPFTNSEFVEKKSNQTLEIIDIYYLN